MTENSINKESLKASPSGSLEGLSICVFCSSSNHVAEKYKKSAFRLGEFIAESGHTLVYGGASGGLMNAVAEGARSKNGEVIGVIAKRIIRMKGKSDLSTQQIVMQNLSERKQLMKALSDIFVVLQGGYGTLDEMFDVVAAGTVGEHRKPLFLVNEDGFYNHFLQEIEQMKSEKCIPEQESYTISVAQNIDDCIEQIKKIKI